MDACQGGRVMRQADARSVFSPGAYGSWSKTAAAIRAKVSQQLFDTFTAKRALVGADARLRRVRRQILVTSLTIRSEF